MLNIYNRRFDNLYVTQKQLRLALCNCCNKYWSGLDSIPDPTLGEPEDHYFNSNNGDLWKKEKDDYTWTLIFQHAEVGAEYSVENGLHAKSGDPSVFHLGGDLIENTFIEMDGNNFTIQSIDKTGYLFYTEWRFNGALPFFRIKNQSVSTGHYSELFMPTDLGVVDLAQDGLGNYRVGVRADISPTSTKLHKAELYIDGSSNSSLVQVSESGISFRFTNTGEYYYFPKNDGTALQYLGTDGSGNLDWYDPGGGGAFYTSDNAITLTALNFQLGGSLVQDTEILSETFDYYINSTPWFINDSSEQAVFLLSNTEIFPPPFGTGNGGIFLGFGDRFAEHSQIVIGKTLTSLGWYDTATGADSIIQATAGSIYLRSTDGINATQIDINQSASIGFLSNTGQYTFASVSTDNTEEQILTLQTGTNELKIRDLSTLSLNTNFLNTDLGPPIANRLHDGTGFSWQFDDGQNYRIQNWFTVAINATDGIALSTQNNDATLSSGSGNASLTAGNIAQVSGIGQVQIKTPAHAGKNIGDVLTLKDAATGRVEYESLTGSVNVVRTFALIYVVLGTEDLIICDCTSNNIIVQFPPAVTMTKFIAVKKTDSSANTVTILPNGAEVIDNVPNIIFNTQNMAYTVYPNAAFSVLWTA